MFPSTPAPLSRRTFLKGAGSAGLLAAAGPALRPGVASALASAPDGTPEQIHLEWGADPSSSVTISWASLAVATSPRVSYGRSAALGTTVSPTRVATYTDGINGETTYTYHVTLTGLDADSNYHYRVTADNDANSSNPFTATFHTAPAGRSAFRFTSFGDLATPNTQWVLSYGQSAYAVAAVEALSPLFHLLNGDLCYANLNPSHQPEVWRDFANNNQRSAANRPWMPCLGNHEVEFNNGPEGFTSYLTRYTLPDNGVSGFGGRWYSFRVGSALFISLDADDVVYQDAAAFNAGTTPQPATGGAIPPGTSKYIRGYSGGAQTAWLQATLSAARADKSLDWIVVQMHQDALSSSSIGNGSDLGIRQAWLPLFDQYQVDLVVCGHDHDYERSFPVRGFDHGVGKDVASGSPVDTMRPRPVVTADPPGRVFDTSTGTVHLILGGGGTNAPLDVYGVDTADSLTQAKLFTRRNAPVLVRDANGNITGYTRPPADAVEDATWSAMRDPSTGYGIAVFYVDPGTTPGGQTSITIDYLHANGADPKGGQPNPDYTVLETFTLVRPRSDGPAAMVPEMSSAAAAVGGAVILGGAALYLTSRNAHDGEVAPSAP